MSFERITATIPQGLTDAVLQRREASTVRVEQKKKQNKEAYFAANVLLADLNKAFSYGAHTAKVFLLLNQARLFGGGSSPYDEDDSDFLNIHQGLRQAYDITHNQWKRGLDNLEAAGLIEVKRAKGTRNRVKLLTEKPKTRQARQQRS